MTRYQTSKTINLLLKALTAGGVLSAGLIAPNSAQLLAKITQPILDRDLDQKELQKLLKYMERTKLVELSVRDNNIHAQLTTKAERRLRDFEIDEIAIDSPKTWDKKWRILIYDIPHDKRDSRYYLLEQLHRLGFYKLQDSTWVYPFPCSQEILEILERLEIDQYTTFIVGDIETKDDATLIKHFSLFKHV